MIRRLDAFICWIGTHRWTRPVVLQTRHARVVSRYCLRCDATTHVEQDVWTDPVRRSRLAGLMVLQGGRSTRRRTFTGGDAA